MEVRLQFANDIIDDIIDSADNPLTVGPYNITRTHLNKQSSNF